MKFTFYFVGIACWLAGLGGGSNLQAQFALHLQHMPQQAGATNFQPAYLGQQDFHRMAVDLEGSFWGQSNAITLDGILEDGNYIGEASKRQMIEQLGEGNGRFQAGGRLGIHVSFQALNQIWQLSYQQQAGLYASVNDSSTLGLLLHGNARYAGQSLRDEDVQFRSLTHRSLGIATAFQRDRLSLGVRLEVLQGLRGVFVDDLSYQLLTSAEGDRIEAQSSYDIRQQDDQHGLGLALDLGAIYALNDRLQLQAGVSELGFIRWNGLQMANSVAIDYRGTEVDNVFGDHFGEGDFFDSDTLRALFIPDTTAARFTAYLPARLYLGATFELSAEERLMAMLVQSTNALSPSTQLPLLNLAYHRKLGKGFTLGANAYGGGLDRYGLGLMVAGQWSLTDELRLAVNLALDNALGMALPGQARGLSLQSGLRILW